MKIASMLNEGLMPDYFLNGRLVLLSKDKTGISTIDNTRPIVILSHVRRVYEKAIKSKLESINSKLLSTGKY